MIGLVRFTSEIISFTYTIGFLHSFRKHNKKKQYSFSDELPSRFKKTLFKDVVKQSDDTIEIDTINRLLVNIGRSDQVLSKDELDMILTECGEKPESTRCLPTAAMVALV
jgi:hypothetical protein